MRAQVMKALSAAIAGMLVLLIGQAFAQQRDLGCPEQGKLAPLTLRTRIPLPEVYGRIDHFGWDSRRGILLVSALGNDTVEIVDSWRRVRSITGLEHPQATVYIPGL